MVVSEERMAALEARTERAGGACRRGSTQAREPRRLARRAGGRGERALPDARRAPRRRRLRGASRSGRPRATSRLRRPRALRRRRGSRTLVGGRVLGWVGGARRARRAAVLPRHRGLARAGSARRRACVMATGGVAAAAARGQLAARAARPRPRPRSPRPRPASPGCSPRPSSPGPCTTLAAGAAAPSRSRSPSARSRPLLALRWEAPGIGVARHPRRARLPRAGRRRRTASAIALMLVAYARRRRRCCCGSAGTPWRAAAFFVAVPQLAAWLLLGRERAVGRRGRSPRSSSSASLTAVAAAGFEWRARSPRLRVSAQRAARAATRSRSPRPGRARARRDRHAGAGSRRWPLAHLAAGLLARRSRARDARARARRRWRSGSCSPTSPSRPLADGLPLVLGWAAGAVGFSALARGARHRVGCRASRSPASAGTCCSRSRRR